MKRQVGRASRTFCGVCAAISVVMPLAASTAQALAQSQSTLDSGAQYCGDAGISHPIDFAEAMRNALNAEPQLIIAKLDLAAAQSDVNASLAPFLPTVQLVAENEKYVPHNQNSPVIVIGNVVLGGSQTNSAYASLDLSWNILNSGRDLAGLHAAKATVRATTAGVDDQLTKTAIDVLETYAELYEAQVEAQKANGAVTTLRGIEARAEERLLQGHGTTIEVGQARGAAFEAEKRLNNDCREVADKSTALESAIGVHVPPEQRLSAETTLPAPQYYAVNNVDIAQIIEDTPSVVESKEAVLAAQAKRQQAERAYGPSVSLSVQRDYLGQSVDDLSEADRHVGPYDYRVGLSITQPIFPMLSQTAQFDRARVEVRRSQAQYEKSRLDAESKVRGALSLLREAEASLRAATAELQESAHILELTNSLYKAGRSSLDEVEHARMDRDKAYADVESMRSKSVEAQWIVVASLRPREFKDVVFMKWGAK